MFKIGEEVLDAIYSNPNKRQWVESVIVEVLGVRMCDVM